MQNAHASILQSIDRPKLTAVVRRALRSDSFELGDWQVSQLGGGFGNPVSLGLHRFEGVGQDGDEPVAWSVILKIFQSPANAGWVDMGEGADQTHWNYWKRELWVYRSDLLASLPEGLAAPRCFDAVELPGDVVMLWLEDVRGAHADAWPLDRYALTARHLGRLNGLYAAPRPWPDFPWFSVDRNRQWLAGTPPLWRSLPWNHPRVLDRYPRPAENFFLRLLLENGRFLAKLDLLPKTLCHGDTYPTNFVSRDSTDGRARTVALDWALMGIQPLGDDLGQLVLGAHAQLQEARQDDVTDALFESYIAGLQDSGCRVDPRWVRFGFVASAALRVGLFQVYLLSEALKQSSDMAEADPARAGAPECFEVRMAKEAFELLESV